VQRQEYKNKIKGKKTRLNDQRIKMLNDIGFSWELQRGGRKRKLTETSMSEHSREGHDRSVDSDSEDNASSSSSSSSFSSDNDPDTKTPGEIAIQVTIPTPGETYQATQPVPAPVPIPAPAVGRRYSGESKTNHDVLSELNTGFRATGHAAAAAAAATLLDAFSTANSTSLSLSAPGAFLYAKTQQERNQFSGDDQMRALLAYQSQMQAEAQARAARSLLTGRIQEFTQDLAERRRQLQLPHRDVTISDLLQQHAPGSAGQGQLHFPASNDHLHALAQARQHLPFLAQQSHLRNSVDTGAFPPPSDNTSRFSALAALRIIQDRQQPATVTDIQQRAATLIRLQALSGTSTFLNNATASMRAEDVSLLQASA